jgi:protein-L-isoaspartate(D-aspartate) O-methyltransferase
VDDAEWPQVFIEFGDRASAEQVAAEHLLPALLAAETAGLLTGWWFVRKFPCWRLRYPPEHLGAAPRLATVLNTLMFDGLITGWNLGIYEPEVHAFGGPDGMSITHTLANRDSRHVLAHLSESRSPTAGLGRRELGVVLASSLLRGAGLDWFEQGDVWAKFASHRPLQPQALSQDRRATLAPAIRRLMTIDTGPTSVLVATGPLAAHADWFTAFQQAGAGLADLARHGTLARGLRAVLAHQLIFSFNRLGLPVGDQAILAALATDVVMGAPDTPVSPRTPSEPESVRTQ